MLPEIPKTPLRVFCWLVIGPPSSLSGQKRSDGSSRFFGGLEAGRDCSLIQNFEEGHTHEEHYWTVHLSVLGLLHHLHHHRPGPRQDQEADGPVVQVQDVEPVDGNQELTDLQVKKRRSEEEGTPG